MTTELSGGRGGAKESGRKRRDGGGGDILGMTMDGTDGAVKVVGEITIDVQWQR